MREGWRGLTIFYQDHPDYQTKTVMFVDSWQGLIPVNLTYHDIQDYSDVYEVWNSVPQEEGEDEGEPFEVHLLKLKPSGKELDPTAFDAGERKAFAEADKEEWAQWIKNQCTRTVPKDVREQPKEAAAQKCKQA